MVTNGPIMKAAGGPRHDLQHCQSGTSLASTSALIRPNACHTDHGTALCRAIDEHPSTRWRYGISVGHNYHAGSAPPRTARAYRAWVCPQQIHIQRDGGRIRRKLSSLAPGQVIRLPLSPCTVQHALATGFVEQTIMPDSELIHSELEDGRCCLPGRGQQILSWRHHRQEL